MPTDPSNQQRSESQRECVDRRRFLAAATGLAGSALMAGGAPRVAKAAPAAMPGALAMNGGMPVRATPLEAKLSTRSSCSHKRAVVRDLAGKRC
jgi:hypothetical protein